MELIFNELDEFELDVFRIYKQALFHIGVNFNREDVQNVIVHCSFNMENGFQAAIEYWHTGKMDHPNAFLIKALNNNWKPNHWHEQWLDDPNFKNPCLLFWEEAAFGLGVEKRNTLIADVTEDKGGYEYILFANGKTLSLARAKSLGWERLLKYAEK